MEREFVLATADASIACSEVGSGPTLLLLHAGGETRAVWKPVAARLSYAGFRAVAIDQRGHGATSGRAGQLSPLVDDACALIDALKAAVVLVGSSLGGFVSLLVGSRKAPQRQVSAIVLVDVVPDPNPDLTRLYLQSLERQMRQGQRWDWDLIEDVFSHKEALRSAAAQAMAPLALVRGEHGVVRNDDVARLRSLVPNLMVRSVKGAGHLVARDCPHELSDVLLELLASLPAADWSAH